MPIGSSKLGVLGAGLVPGGSVTFNTSGNWTVPPGVKKVSITGIGGSGNPGNAGNPGNSGNPGFGGGGGGGGFGECTPRPASGAPGGRGLSANPTGICGAGANSGQASLRPVCGPPNTSSFGNDGGAGQSGSGGSAGSAGNSGNAGQPSSALGNNFAGGAAGNAGTAGNAGNSGSGGNGGGLGGSAPPNFAFPFPRPCNTIGGVGGPGGNGGGAGTPGWRVNSWPPALTPSKPPTQFSGGGGGGAGATNDGSTGTTTPSPVPQGPGPRERLGTGGRGGTTSNYSVSITGRYINPAPSPLFEACFRAQFNPSCFPNNVTGGSGGYPGVVLLNPAQSNLSEPATINRGGQAVGFTPSAPGPFVDVELRQPNIIPTSCIFGFTINQPAYNAVRSGGGGGSGHRFRGGGGGGGGRGNAGNAGGTGGAGGTGAAGTPQTFNCVTVTPGATVPITVGSPGGQIVISWNPQ